MLALMGKVFINISKLKNYCIKKYYKKQFKLCGKNVYIGNGCSFTCHTITIGDDVSIGKNCCLQSTHGEIIIGSHVMFGPGVHIHGGNHKFHEIGKLMKELEKTSDDSDGKVIIGDDVWIGANVIILKGVTVGEGSIIGAGAVVFKDVPKYSIYTGSPSPVLRARFLPEELEKHKKALRERRITG